MNITRTFTAVILTGGITFAGATAAMATDPSTTPAPAKNQARIEKLCKRYEAHEQQAATRKAHLQEQLTKLTDQLAQNPDHAARIQVRIDRVKLQLDRLAAAEAAYQKNCKTTDAPPAEVPAPSTTAAPSE